MQNYLRIGVVTNIMYHPDLIFVAIYYLLGKNKKRSDIGYD